MAQSPRSTLHLVESLRISASENDLTLVGLATRGPDGTIWLTQPQDGNIVAFAPSGEKLRVVGGRGEGPGEFDVPAGLLADSTGLRVFDATLRRVTHFDYKGRLVATTRVEVPATMGRAVSQRSVGVERVGYLLIEPPASAGSRQSEAALYLANLSGGEVVRLLGFNQPKCSADKRTGNTFVGVVIPFCHQAQLDFSPNGRFVGVALPTSRRGAQTGFVLNLRATRGPAIVTSRHDLGANPIPRRSLDSAVARLWERQRDRNPDLASEIVNSGRIPDSYPPMRGIAISDSGTAWVTIRTGPSGAQGVLVIRPDGSEAGYAPLPPSVLAIGWVSERQALALQETPDGLYDVVLYTID